MVEISPPIEIPDWVTRAQKPSPAYGEAALNAECRNVALAIKGTRNDTLNKATFAIAQLVAAGQIDEATARSRLAAAALSVGLNADEIKRTMDSGFVAGLAHPRVALEMAADKGLPGISVAPTVKAVHGSTPQKMRSAVRATPYSWTDPETIPVREWIYGRHLIRKFVSATVAPGGVGKTSLGIVETLAMVSGKDLLGTTLPAGQIRAWYLNLEDPREEVTRQIQAAALFYNLSPLDIGDRLFVDSGREQDFVIAETLRDGAVICRPVVESIIAELVTRAIDVMTIDPFVSSHEVSENDNGAMDLVVKQWGKIADAANCAIHLVHHTRKQYGDFEVTAESSRGGKALTDGCRSVRAINRMTKDEADKAGVENPRRYFRTFNDKANLSPPSEKSDWYCLESVSLNNGGSAPSDELGVVTSWSWPDAFEDVTESDLRKVQAALGQGDWKESAQSKTWAGTAVADVLGLDIADKEARAKVKALLKTWIKNGALKVVKRLGPDRHMAPFIEVGERENDA